MENPKRNIRTATIVLAVCLLLTSAAAIFIFCFFPEIEEYIRLHRRYEVYGGVTAELRDSEFFEDMESGKSFCFLGDSITHGSATGGVTWYHPLLPYIKGSVSNVSHGGWEVLDLVLSADTIPPSEVYVIAIGINDVLFPEDENSAPTADEFINRCNQLAGQLSEISPNSKIYFIAPWSFVGTGKIYDKRGDQFRTSLSEWCDQNDYICINPDPIIMSVLENNDISKYMINDFHPNAMKGVGLFSYAVLKESHNQRNTSVS